MLQFRPVTIEDLPLLLYWNKQPHILESIGDDWDWATELAYSPDWREQLIAELDGHPIGFVQIIDPAREETHYWGDVPKNLRALDIWIGESTDIGKGYGTQMMRLALDRCFDDPQVTAVLVDPSAANVAAHRFYERLGFRFLENRQLGGDDTFVYRFERPTPFNPGLKYLIPFQSGLKISRY
jgi:aminoglycoside 6'-N-acetyltransferase